MVEQLGLAIMPSCHSASCGLTWLTISGTAASMRQALELSMTVAPRATASGASWRETSPPAEKSAMSTPSHASGVASPPLRVRPAPPRVDPALAVDRAHHNHDLVPDRDNVLDGRDVVVGQLADPDQAFLAGQDLDEAAEAHDPGDLAQVEPADLYVAGERLDPLDGLAGVLARHCRDLDRAVVLDVDLGAGFLLDLADHGATLADDVADLLGVDLDGDDARRVVAHLRAAGRDDRVHLVEDRHPRGVGLFPGLGEECFAHGPCPYLHLVGRYALW